MGKKTKSGKDNRSSKPRNYIDKRYFGQVPNNDVYELNPDNGYVIYRRSPKDTSYWYQVWKQGTETLKNAISSMSINDTNFKKVGDYLVSLGKKELQKEIKLIQEILGGNFDVQEVLTDPAEFKRFITLLNYAILGKDEFEGAVKRIQKAIFNVNEHGTSYAPPSVSNLFVEYFLKDYIKKIEDIAHLDEYSQYFYENNLDPIENLLAEEFRKQFQQTFETFIDRAIKEGKLKEGSLYGEGKDYEKVKQYLNELEKNAEEQKEFFKRIEGKISFDNIFSRLKKNMNQIGANMKKGNFRKSGLKGALNSYTTSKSRSRVGGSVEELILQAISTITVTTNVLNAKGGKGTVVGFNPKSETLKTDQALVISMGTEEVENSVKDMINDFNQKRFADLNEAANEMSKFTNQVFGKLSKGFIVYTSQKMYKLGTKFESEGGFAGSTDRKITALREIMSRLNSGKGQRYINNLIKIALNAIPGAYLESEETYINSILKLEIAHCLAYLLFDDWVSFSSEVSNDKNAIHIFSLEGMEVPLSYLLIRVGQSFQKAESDTDSYIKTTISYGSGILFPDGNYDYNRNEGHTTQEIILAAWNKQREVAEQEVKFSIHFLGAFSQLFGELV